MCVPASERLTYERLTPERVAILHGLARDRYVARFLLDGEEVPLAWAAAEVPASDALFGRLGAGLWLVREKAGPDPIGFAGFRIFAELGPEPQLLYALLEQYTNRGYATEIAAALVELARRQRFERILSAVDEPNLASRRVLEKVGFVEAGEVPGAFGAIVFYVHGRAGNAPAGFTRALEIANTWDGRDLPERERVSVHLAFAQTELRLAVDAPFHADPPPDLAPGACPRLWEHEVVEFFLLGDDERYLEVELGPHGHHLVLALHGRRNIVSALPHGLPIFYRAERSGSRWRGAARVPLAWYPPGLNRCNVYAMSGAGSARRHLAWQPVPGSEPDFHRLEHFAPLDPQRED
jgi:RimJ/RimL family protein N-acetyltransferase